MPESKEFQIIKCYNLQAQITSGTAEPANGIDLTGTDLCGVFVPSVFTGTSLSFKIAPTLTGAYTDVYADGALVSIAVTAGKYIALSNLAVLAGARFIKPVSSANEASDRILTLATRPV